MRFTEEKTLQIYSKPSWAEFRWDEKSQTWRYQKSSEGFMRRHSIPESFSEQERLLLEIRLSVK
jgi:hypothetical protein